MIKLVGIDVDGTLVGSSGIVDSRVWEAAAQARASGIRLALCSGRPAFGLALDYARQLDPSGWHVFQNGASAIHLGTNESRSAAIPPDNVRSLIGKARSTGELLELYDDSSYAIERASTWAIRHAEILGVPFVSRPFESLAGAVVRAQWLIPAGTSPDGLIENPAGLEIAYSSSPLMPDVRFVGITRGGVSKGSAITAIAAACGIELKDIMYVGDAGNDLPALQLVGHPVAMGNADAAVRAIAVHTVGHVDDAGLAQALNLARTL